MFIKSKNGIFNLDRFNSVQILDDGIKRPSLALIGTPRDASFKVTIETYNSYEEACWACNHIAEMLDCADDVAYIDSEDDEEENQSTGSPASVRTEQISLITFDSSSEITTVYPKSGNSYQLKGVENIIFN